MRYHHAPPALFPPLFQQLFHIHPRPVDFITFVYCIIVCGNWNILILSVTNAEDPTSISHFFQVSAPDHLKLPQEQRQITNRATPKKSLKFSEVLYTWHGETLIYNGPLHIYCYEVYWVSFFAQRSHMHPLGVEQQKVYFTLHFAWN